MTEKDAGGETLDSAGNTSGERRKSVGHYTVVWKVTAGEISLGSSEAMISGLKILLPRLCRVAKQCVKLASSTGSYEKHCSPPLHTQLVFRQSLLFW